MNRRQAAGLFGPQQMPPLATELVDPNGVEVIRRWISALR